MIAQPLTQLLQKGVGWKWTRKQTDAFKQLKQLIVSAPVLTHYDPKLPVILAVLALWHFHIYFPMGRNDP